MTPRQDPYRVLGLVPGATAGEIRSAYRRLAKLHHPDTAGERSLPRFLAIQAAYEELVDGDGLLRGRGWPGRAAADGPRRAPGPGASSAHRASRDGWRARQAGSARGAGSASAGDPAAGASPGAGSPGGASPGASGASGSSGASGASSAPRPGSGAGSGGRGGTEPRAGGPRPGGHAGSQRRPERRTARPGSTTYDEAAQPLDPSWEGGAWYGASSGRYWTLNPREYADPRKHGPEYQERARRAARQEGQQGATTAHEESVGTDERQPAAARRPRATMPRPGPADGHPPEAGPEGSEPLSARSGRLVWRSRRRPAP